MVDLYNIYSNRPYSSCIFPVYSRTAVECAYRERCPIARVYPAFGPLILVDLRVDKKIDDSTLKAIILHNKDRIGTIINKILNIGQGKAGYAKRFNFF